MDRKTRVLFFVIAALLTALALIVFALLSLRQETAPLVPPEDEPVFAVNQPPVGSLPYEPVSSIKGQINEGGGLAGSPFIGSFINSYVSLNASNADDVFKAPGAGDAPRLEIADDGGFTLVINAYEAGMLAVRGTIAVSADEAVFTITERPSVGFFGDDAESFTMRIIDEDNMRYSGEQLGTITKGDLFTREGD